jgi:hypothetical protein
VYQSEGPHIDPNEKAVPIHIGPFSESGRARIERVEDDVVGRVCFAAVVRDLVPQPAEPTGDGMQSTPPDTGKISASGYKEVCVETVSSPFFYGCATTGGRAPNHAGWMLAALFGAAIAARRRTSARARA